MKKPTPGGLERLCLGFQFREDAGFKTFAMSGTEPKVASLLASAETEEEAMWLALAAITLALAIGFSVLVLAGQRVEY
jgi:hypothetical protein